MKRILMAVILAMAFVSTSWAANVELHWDQSLTATGYRLYQSTDNGATWDTGLDVGNVLTYIVPDVPDSGIVLFRVSAYNDNGESIRSWSGAWFNKDWQPPVSAGGAGIR